MFIIDSEIPLVIVNKSSHSLLQGIIIRDQ